MENKITKKCRESVILNLFRNFIKETKLPRLQSFALNDNKKAMTMAEIIIVVVIVAIIAGVFMAMPKKNVGKLDRAKYYVAYDMMKRFNDEIIVNYGRSGYRSVNILDVFKKYVNYVGENNRYILLSNGMVVMGPINPITNSGSGLNSYTFMIDIDGMGSAPATTTDIKPSGQMGKDMFNIKIWENGNVEPLAVSDTTDWISFRVYKFKNDGSINNLLYGVSYNAAISKMKETSDGQDCNGDVCFMEAIPPLK